LLLLLLIFSSLLALPKKGMAAGAMLNGKIVQFNACQNLFMTTLSSAIPVSKLLLGAPLKIHGC